MVREYLRWMRIEGGVRAVCEDFRAAAGIDLEHDTVEDAAGSKLAMPLLVLWGARGAAGKLYDVLGVWREKADNVTGGPMDCGHILQEEAPEPLLENSWRSSAPFDVPPASRQRASRATAGASYPRRLSSLSTLRSPMRRRSCYGISSAKRLSLRALSLVPRAFHSVCRSNWKSSWK